MSKAKTRWVCQECGMQSSRFLGRCTDCGGWGTVVEEFIESRPNLAGRAQSPAATACLSQALDSLDSGEQERISSGFAQLDEVLGGGLVPGSVILLSGDPGVGKSTLLLQMAKEISRHLSLVYVSGEESAQQIKLRAARIKAQSPQIFILADQNLQTIKAELSSDRAQVAIIDSIQSIYHGELQSAPGSVSQVRECAADIIAQAKSQELATILVGHVTKDGSLAGPKVLEHMVDVVLQFEGDRSGNLRIMRAIKNRYGSTSEVAIFSMNESGLAEVDNPSAIFLADRLQKTGSKQAASGTCILAALEGKRTLLLEAQALVSNSYYQNPRRVANGFDYNRLLLILAVLEKRVGLSLSKSDVYVNIVGGFEFADPSGDLGIAVAVATSHLDRSVNPGLICIGEIGLSGEIRPVSNLEKRLKEASRLGFTSAIVPSNSLPKGSFDQMKVIGVEYLSEALEKVCPGESFDSRKKTLFSRGNNESKSAVESPLKQTATSVIEPFGN